jgi:hypothetical protein
MHVLQTKNYIDTSTSFCGYHLLTAICRTAIIIIWMIHGALYLMGENLEVVWSKFATLS